jgi:hypothetical protein
MDSFITSYRRRIILFIAAAILFQQAGLSQVLRLPVIFDHYSEHRTKDHSITFSHFLSIHYLGDDHDDSDNDRDHELPFKSFSATADAEADPDRTHSIVPPYFPPDNLADLYLSPDASGVSSGIWQPPRIW